MVKDVLIKDVDEEVYRRAKAAAALEGITMGKAVTDALARWTEEERDVEMKKEYERDLEFVRRAWKKEFERHKGKAVVVTSGRLQGVFDSYETAAKFASRFRVALTFVVQDYPEQKEIEIGPDLEI